MDQSEFDRRIKTELDKQSVGEVKSNENELIQVKISHQTLGIKPNWVGVLINQKWQCFYGRFTSVNPETETFIFRLNELTKQSELKNRDIVYFFDSYWGERVEIVLDRNAGWIEKKFDSGSGIKIGNMLRKLKTGELVPDGAVEIKGGWDHEHCEICMEEISEKTENGYQSKYDQWICKVCYARYYDAVNLGFIC